MNNMLKQAQKMQEDVARVQGEVEEMEFSSSSGSGMIEVTVTGKKLVKAVRIKPEAVDPDDAEMLEDLLVVALNDALHKVDETLKAEMAKVTGGLNLPGMGL